MKFYISKHPNSKRKYAYTWELVVRDGDFILINTHRANAIVKEAIQNGQIDELKNFKIERPEAKFGDSRFDFLLQAGDSSEMRLWLEVKSVTLLEGRRLLFPDAISERGQKHLRDLIIAKERGENAALLFLINRTGGDAFQAADHIDPTYAELLKQAAVAGVKIMAYRTKISAENISLGAKCKVCL